MALTRKYLAALGIDAEKVDEIISAHVEVVDGLKKERDDLTAKVTNLETENNKIKTSGEEALSKLRKEFDDYKADVSGKEAHAAKAQAYTALLKSVGVSDKRIGAIIKVTDIDGLELDNSGKIRDEQAQADRIKTEWAEFIETKQVQGASTANPPQSNGGNVAKTKEEILKIKDTTERQKAWAEYLRNGEKT